MTARIEAPGAGLRALIRYWWLVVLGAGLAGLVGVLVADQLADPPRSEALVATSEAVGWPRYDSVREIWASEVNGPSALDVARGAAPGVSTVRARVPAAQTYLLIEVEADTKAAAVAGGQAVTRWLLDLAADGDPTGTLVARVEELEALTGRLDEIEVQLGSLLDQRAALDDAGSPDETRRVDDAIRELQDQRAGLLSAAATVEATIANDRVNANELRLASDARLVESGVGSVEVGLAAALVGLVVMTGLVPVAHHRWGRVRTVGQARALVAEPVVDLKGGGGVGEPRVIVAQRVLSLADGPVGVIGDGARRLAGQLAPELDDWPHELVADGLSHAGQVGALLLCIERGRTRVRDLDDQARWAAATGLPLIATVLVDSA